MQSVTFTPQKGATNGPFADLPWLHALDRPQPYTALHVCCFTPDLICTAICTACHATGGNGFAATWELLDHASSSDAPASAKQACLLRVGHSVTPLTSAPAAAPGNSTLDYVVLFAGAVLGPLGAPPSSGSYYATMSNAVCMWQARTKTWLLPPLPTPASTLPAVRLRVHACISKNGGGGGQRRTCRQAAG